MSDKVNVTFSSENGLTDWTESLAELRWSDNEEIREWANDDSRLSLDVPLGTKGSYWTYQKSVEVV